MTRWRKMEIVFTKIHKALGSQQYLACDEILACLVGEEDMIIIGSLRASGPAKHLLDNWEPLLDSINDKVEPRLLRGLI